jgi:histone deacetylase 6
MDAFIPRTDENLLQQQLQDLMCYLWDNYLQIYEGMEDIFLIGVGSAYLGVKVLLISRGTSRCSASSPWPTI